MKNILPFPEITRKSSAIYLDKGNGTKVNYYIYPEFEIHANEIAPKAKQEWHHHNDVEEVLLVNNGELAAFWLEGDQKKEDLLVAGDLIRVGTSVHTFANNTDQPVSFTIFRYVPDGNDKHDLIKNDRHADKVES